MLFWCVFFYFVGSFTHLLSLWEECLCGITQFKMHCFFPGLFGWYAHSIFLFFLFCVYKLWWYWCRDYLSPSDIIASYPHLVVSGTGLAFGYLVVRYLFLFGYPKKMLFKASFFFSRFYCQLPVFMSLYLVTVLAGYRSLVSLFLGSSVNV